MDTPTATDRVLWLLEELEVPYEMKKYQRCPEMLAPLELKEVNPLVYAPVITDGGRNVAESGAIVEYLIGKYGNERAQHSESGTVESLYFTHHSAEASLMPMLVNELVFSIIPDKSLFFLRPLLRGVFAAVSKRMVDPSLKAHASLIEDHLSKAGGGLAEGKEPTSADYMMAFFPEARDAEDKEALGPNCTTYIFACPCQGLERGGEYVYANLA